MSKIFDRENLYEEVWTRPGSVVAKEHGVTISRLRKVCKALAVPLPGQGHWAKIGAGVRIALPPLLDAPTIPSSLSLNGKSKRVVGTPQESDWLAQRIAFERNPENAIAVDAMPQRFHHALRDVQSHFETIAARIREAEDRFLPFGTEEAGLNLPRRGQKSVIRVGTLGLSRAIALLNALCIAAARRGFAAAYHRTLGRIVLTGYGADVPVCIAEKDGAESEAFETVPLRFFVEAAAGRPSCVDDGEVPLEKSLNTVFELAYRQVIRHQQEIRRRGASDHAWAVIQRERRLATIRLTRKQETIEARRRRRESLLEKARAWKGARIITEYLNHIEKRATARGKGPSLALSEWLAWGRRAAHEMQRQKHEASTVRDREGDEPGAV